LDPPFFVIATQNPLEQSGTFPLPESQMDRFLMRIHLGYPDREAEEKILRGESNHGVLDELDPCVDRKEVLKIQDTVAGLHVSDIFIQYLQDLMEFSRNSGIFQTGLSPRSGLALAAAAKGWAFLEGRDYVVPEDLQHVLPWVVGHRLRSARDHSSIPMDGLVGYFSKVPVPV
ncbi:MAG: MoxR family ATPase, partial [Desulfovibrionales bacterium]|nr:MoxR family ATPase [Desulfovibrionales bacterium]